MADYFTSDHFKLLNKWKGQKRDESNPEQNRAYEDLKKAYEVTEAWANEVKKRLFPPGLVKVRKRPTSQANSFLPYNWARIYPTADAPKELAYTVGIGADEGFVVKIDTVGLNDSDPVRGLLLGLRGAYDNTSPIVAKLPIAEGLSKSLPELVEWSIGAIRAFRLRYEDVVSKLNIGKTLSDEDLLNHFDGKPAFKTFRASWSPLDKILFCRLARSVHAAGFDWWHMGKNIQVRFGRKNPGNERAVGVLGIIRGTRTRTISSTRDIGALPRQHREVLSEDLVSKIESALASEREAFDEWWPLETERPGLWPDQLREDPTDQDEDTDDEAPLPTTASRKPFNRIYYGPPGTGKTYELSKILRRDYEQSITSVSNEEWRREVITEKIAKLKWWEGAAAALYQLGGKAKVSDLLAHPFIQAIIAATPSNKSPTQTLWGALQYHTIDASTTVNTKRGVAPAIFDKTTDSFWQFAGNWTEQCADLIELVDSLQVAPKDTTSVQRFSFVTFHQSYGYEEFVEGLRPVVVSNEVESGEIQYEIRPGVFKELCRKAHLAPDQHFAMLIDEINRGNISKIFGELITLIEPDKREGAEHAISVTLPYSGQPFSVPANVDIIGTMNTADRSLALLDTALRRRFDFIQILPDSRDEQGAPLHGLRVTAGDKEINIPQMLTTINQRIEALYDRDHCIGHAYFTGLFKLADGEERFVGLAQLFKDRVLPLLDEYFFEDRQKIRLVLADNQKPETARFITESRDHEDELSRLFGDDHGLDSFSTAKRYVDQESAFSNPDAYIGIYETLS